ncbi:putative amidohydrolase [Granulicella aggregans]|uniref:Putative amidohydrolase n=1 Tax=Granulicella aggregans TaxID=474949 RepID=A0A7W8E7B1_9BACT|nr:carbon-nitrogen hydrolase family protein [Granulicella aggregans]MBB5060065.1 putative amidohydrolase [Granulicella aggregans]
MLKIEALCKPATLNFQGTFKHRLARRMQSNEESQSTRVAIVQASPHPSDLASGLRKALALVEEAAEHGAQIICFAETFLPGYPAWLDFCPGAALWNHAPVKEVFAALRANSVVVPGKETQALGEAAARLRVGIVMGISERVRDAPGHGTLFNSMLYFAEEGRLVNHHRKLIPTYSERMVWGQGDAAGLRIAKVHNLNLGGAICWEHWMPLTRQHLHNAGEQIHIAVWPTVHEMHQIASRHYAFEGRCFVLAAGQIMKASDLPIALAPLETLDPQSLIERGGSAIIAPDGRYLAGPVFDEEVILYATLDLQEIERELMTMDVSGHYSRPDIFRLQVTASDRGNDVNGK